MSTPGSGTGSAVAFRGGSGAGRERRRSPAECTTSKGRGCPGAGLALSATLELNVGQQQSRVPTSVGSSREIPRRFWPAMVASCLVRSGRLHTSARRPCCERAERVPDPLIAHSDLPSRGRSMRCGVEGARSGFAAAGVARPSHYGRPACADGRQQPCRC